MSIEGRSIMVTGAASGIGAATANRLARSGVRVTAIDTSADKLEVVVAEIKSSGGRIISIPGDVTDFEAMQRAVATAITEMGGIDGLVGCAGIADASSTHQGDPSHWERVLKVNAFGAMATVRALLPHLLEAGHGDIIVVTSASGRITYVGEPAYVASKHAAVAFLDSLRKELADSDIRVTSIEPGLVDTPMSRSHPFIDTVLHSVQPLSPSDIADIIEYCLSLPQRVNVNEVLLRPTRQGL